MKLLLIISSLFLLVSCTQEKVFKYSVTGFGCHGNYINEFSMGYVGYEENTPYLSGNVLEMYRNTNDGKIFPMSIDLNICDFSYTSEEIK